MKEISDYFATYRPLWDCGKQMSVGTAYTAPESFDVSGVYRLADRTKLRREHFGGILQNRKSRAIRYFDSEAFEVLAEARAPTKGKKLAVMAEKAPELIPQLISDGTLVKLDYTSHARNSDAELFDFGCSSKLQFSRPIVLELAPTLKCLRACDYCSYSSSPQVDRAFEKPTKFWVQLIEEAAAEGAFSVLFTGGDPLQREDINVLLSAADNVGLLIAINSDLTSLPDATLRHLSTLRNLDAIKITLDGPNARTHDALRGKGAFKCVESNVRRLVDAGITVDAGMVITKQNYQLVGQTAKACHRLGISGLHLTSLYLAGRASVLGKLKPTNDDLRVAEEQYIDAILANLVRSTESSLLVAGNPFQYGRNKGGYLSNISNYISVGVSALRVDSLGRYVTSNRVSGTEMYIAGEAGKDSLSTVWLESPVLSRVRDIWSEAPRNKFWAVSIQKIAKQQP